MMLLPMSPNCILVESTVNDMLSLDGQYCEYPVRIFIDEGIAESLISLSFVSRVQCRLYSSCGFLHITATLSRVQILNVTMGLYREYTHTFPSVLRDSDVTPPRLIIPTDTH